MGANKVKRTSKKLRQLQYLYFTPSNPASYGGLSNLLAASKAKSISKKLTHNWLTRQSAYTLHKPVRRKFKRRKTVVSGIDDQFQADLIDVHALKSENDGFTFILTVIDVFSKYAWALPIKSKSGENVSTALHKIFEERKCRVLQTDKGREFLNSKVQPMLITYQIKHFTSENDDIKASIVERWNRTIMERLYRWFTKNNSRRYINVLDKLVEGYNKRFHNTIGMSPASVNRENEEDVWLKIYEGEPFIKKSQKSSFKTGEPVRISKTKLAFTKGYTPNWSTEIFFINKRITTNPRVYELEDSNGEILQGRFYEAELQRVTLNL